MLISSHLLTHKMEDSRIRRGMSQQTGMEILSSDPAFWEPPTSSSKFINPMNSFSFPRVVPCRTFWNLKEV